MRRALYFMFMGALGGFLAFLVSEPFAPKNVGADVEWAKHQFVFGLAMGVFTGVLIGFASGQMQGSSTHMRRGALAGLVIGAIAGTLGVSIAAMVYKTLGGGVMVGVNVLPRAIGWAVFGGIVGMAEGAVGMSGRRFFQGALGGVIGGAIGGVAFEVAGTVVGPLVAGTTGGNEVGMIPRAIGLVITSAAIGLMIGIVEALSRRAWVRLVLGKNEGKEWSLDGNQTILGRSERADIPLFMDPNIGDQHAVIQKAGLGYEIIDVGHPLGIGVNGIRVPKATLNHGDTINIGQNTLTFQLRSGKAVAPVSDQQRAYQPVQQVQIPQAQTSAFPAQQAAGYALVACSGPLTGQRFPVGMAADLGRESAVVPMSADTMASRRHARVEPDPSGLRITDLGSTNGTWANGQRVQTQLLRRGDILKIGSSEFRVE